MIIDLHIHTNRGSYDSVIKPDVLVEMAKRMGLDGVCITEHGNKKSESVEELRSKYDFLVLGGMEASTELGDILIFGLDTYPREIHRAADLRRYVEERGGFMIAAHPFRYDFSNKPWLASPNPLAIEEACQRKILQLVDAIEVVNGWSTQEDVDFTLEVCSRLSVKGTGGSDAHTTHQIGLCVTAFENGVRNEQELVIELQRGNYKALDRRSDNQKGPTNFLSQGLG